MAERTWVLNDAVPLGAAQGFDASATPGTWSLNVTPLAVQTFQAAAGAWNVPYWGPGVLAFPAQTATGVNAPADPVQVLTSVAAVSAKGGAKASAAAMQATVSVSASAKGGVLAPVAAVQTTASSAASSVKVGARAPAGAVAVATSVGTAQALGGAKAGAAPVQAQATPAPASALTGTRALGAAVQIQASVSAAATGGAVAPAQAVQVLAQVGPADVQVPQGVIAPAEAVIVRVTVGESDATVAVPPAITPLTTPGAGYGSYGRSVPLRAHRVPAVATVEPVEIRAVVALLDARGGGRGQVLPVTSPVRMGAVSARGGASVHVPPVAVDIETGPTGATGIQNPPDEELAMLLALIA